MRGFKMLAQWIGENVVKPTVRTVLILALILGSAAIWENTHAQLQQSSGAGGNVTQWNGTTVSVNNGTTDAGTLRVSVSSDSTGQIKLAAGAAAIGSITNTGFNVTGTLPSGTNAIGTVRTESATSCGATIVDSGLTAIPATTTAIPSMGAAATCMQAIYLNNTLATAATCSVTDVTGPTAYVSGFIIPGNSNLLLTFGGLKFAGGGKWFCNIGTVNGQALGYQ